MEAELPTSTTTHPFAEAAYAACAARGKALNRRLTRLEWLQAVSEAYVAFQGEEARKTERTARISSRQQTELFNALCLACGINPLETTSAMKKTVSVAIADIRTVTPNVTPDEIASRARTYKNKHRDWPLTPMALTKHWGECGYGDVAKTYSAQNSVEPQGWQDVVPDMMEGAEAASISYVISRGWPSLSSSLQSSIRKRLEQRAINS